VLENFRPGTLERWGLGYEDLARVNPALVMLRVSAYGQTGPLRDRPGFARIAHAFSGLSYLAGEPGRPPVVPGTTTLADYASGLFGAVGVLIALRHAEATGEGQVIDVGLYESMFRVLDELAPAFGRYGILRERMGADTVHVVPHSHYQTRDGDWVALACSNDRMWWRLARAMGRPELGEGGQFASAQARISHRDEVNALVAEWVASRNCVDVIAACEAVETPCSKLLSIVDIFQNEQYAERCNLRRVNDERAGEFVVPGPVPRLSKTPSDLRTLGPALGSGNKTVLGKLLGVTDVDLSRLEAAGVI
jgi:crotonobetainyl-CoA:carnitine CoA-transferase CaiB-like acyl-CoA transferase